MAIEQMAQLKNEAASVDPVSSVLSRSSLGIPFFTAYAETRSDISPMMESLASYIGKHNWKIIAQDVFGEAGLYQEGVLPIEQAFGKVDWPIMCMQGGSNTAGFCYSTQLYVVSGTSVEPIFLDGHLLGYILEDEDAKYCMLRNIGPLDTQSSKTKQASDTWETMESALHIGGMEIRDVVRTWFYVDDILSWYDEFNAVRTSFFRDRGLLDVPPASTGIGVGNYRGTALIAGALAIKSKNENIVIRAIPSPLQCPALEYGSSFSRAIEVKTPNCRALYISGTASIKQGGATAYGGDVAKQIEVSMNVASAILKSCAMDWSDVTRCIAYFNDPMDIPLFGKYCKSAGLPQLPVITVAADICRSDLLFEIEVDAVAADSKGL